MGMDWYGVPRKSMGLGETAGSDYDFLRRENRYPNSADAFPGTGFFAFFQKKG